MTALPAEKKYTYADYLEGPEGERAELIEGQIYDMAPAPSGVHQEILADLTAQLRDYLRGKKCKVFPAPYDVRLFAGKEDTLENVDTVVQPDISIVCDPDKLDEKGCKGAPDMVAEILSRSSQRHDRLTKFNLYQRAGVREYWIIDPFLETVQVFLLQDGRYAAVGFYVPADKVKVAVLDDCTVDLSTVFPE